VSTLVILIFEIEFLTTSAATAHDSKLTLNPFSSSDPDRLRFHRLEKAAYYSSDAEPARMMN
jgi:hypothetical protein